MKKQQKINIKIFGLDIENAKIIEEKIKVAFKEEPFVESIVVTTITSTVTNLYGKSQPYIQLEHMNSMIVLGYCQKVIPILKTFKMDVHCLRLEEIF